MAESVPVAQRCKGCHAELAPSLLTCPGCGRLVHVQRLNELAAAAEKATAEQRWEQARDFWRSALELLPAHAPQSDAISKTRISWKA